MSVIAHATINVVPSTKGFAAKLGADILSASDATGKKAGDAINTGVTDGVGKASKFASLALGAVGGIAALGIGKAIAAVTGLVGEAVAASDATDKFKQTLQFAGLKTDAIDRVTKAARGYADATVYDLGTIQNTAAQLAANGVPNYMKLTEAAGNLNAVAGGNSDTFKSVAMMMTQTAGAGKLTTENWNQLADAIPGASGILQNAMKAAGAYTGNFRDAMAKGQITAGEFNAAIQKVGLSDVAKKAATSTATMEGAFGNLQATVVGAMSDAISAVKPLLTAAIGGLSSIVSGAVAAIKNVIGFVQQNMTWIGPIAAAIAAIVGAIALWQGAIAAWQTAVKIATGVQAAFNLVMNANPVMLAVTAIAALVAGLVYFFTQTELGRQVWANVTKFIGDAWNNTVSFLTDTLKGIGDFFVTVWDGIKSFIGDAAKAIVNIFLNWTLPGLIIGHWNDILAFFRKIPGWVSDVFNAAKTWLLQAGVNIVIGLYNGIRNFWTTVTGWLGGVGSAIGGFFSGAARWLVSAGSNVVSGLYNGIKNIWTSVVSWFKSLPGLVGGFFAGAGKWLWDAGVNVVQGLLNGIRSLAGTIGRFFLDLLPGWIVGPFKAALGIHSPSRLFHGLGGYIGQGLIDGMAGMKSSVAAGAQGLADAAADGFAKRNAALEMRYGVTQAADVNDRLVAIRAAQRTERQAELALIADRRIDSLGGITYYDYSTSTEDKQAKLQRAARQLRRKTAVTTRKASR